MSVLPFEADIIVAGGGTTGCVVASRLASAEPSLRILIIEAGPPTLEDLAYIQPARYLSHLVPGSQTIKLNVGKESADLGGRSPVVPCAQCLGGGSSVNFAMYSRASRSDYDEWEKVYGNKGWGSHDLLPLMKKMETYQVAPDKPTHGYQGPIKVSHGGAFTNIGKEFLEVGAQYDTRRGWTDDPNDMTTVNAYGRVQKYIDRETGRRSDVPHNYIYNRELDNLEILTGYHVKRVIIEDGRAVGVEFLPNARIRPDEDKVARIARTRRLVVVSAGAFGSPAILERSGIGDRSLLQSLGIDVVSDLPGVGENYQDHYVLFPPYLAADDAETLDGVVRGDPEEIERWSSQWLRDGSGLMAHNGIDAAVKLRPIADELSDIGPEFLGHWQRVFANASDKPICWLECVSMYVGDHSCIPARKYFSMGHIILYPEAVGYVHISSAEDVDASQDFDPKYLSKPSDIAALRWAYKRGREVARRMASYRGEYAPRHPVFPKGSQAACNADANPVPMHTAEIVYTEHDNRALDEHLQKSVATCWHSLGTCAMKPRDQEGVLGSSLNVYGVSGLKVADLSIAPSNVGTNTYSTALIIGEKAAAIILSELNAH